MAVPVRLVFAWYMAMSALWNSAVGGLSCGVMELMPMLAPMMSRPRVFRTGFLLVLCYFLAVQPSVVNFLRCAVSES